MPKVDAIIVGGGHNGLVCAAYLVKHGLKPLVLERRAVVGGAAVTPGGGVSGIPGYNAAREVLRDLGRESTLRFAD
jgi:phytoene dehydrogenase-like protein